MDKRNIIENIMSKTEIYGRLVDHSSGKVILYDCPYWPGKASTWIFSRFPNISIAVEQNSFSLSGYIIIFDEISHVKNRQRFLYSLLIFVLVFGMLSTANYYAKNVYKMVFDWIFGL